jgi:hypothetical protein
MSQAAGPAQLPLHDTMFANQGTGKGQVNLGQFNRQWIGALQNLAGEQTGNTTLNVVEYGLAAGANSLDPAKLGLPATPSGLAVVILQQPGDATITWSSDFAGAVTGIDATAGTGSVFLFAAFSGQWVMLAYPTTGIIV